ncbi:MAG: GTP-binding protein, partial [Candidatus Absconditicoccaceae bacterium]
MKLNAHLPLCEQEKQNNIVNKISENSEATGNEVFLILGFLGAGKTTLLKDLAGYLSNQGEQFKVIVNDIGKYNIDAERLKDFSPVALTDGCICCQDLSGLKSALEELKGSNEKILIEPSGIADGKAIKRVIEELGMQGRVITLVNAQSFPTMSKAEEQIASTQLSLANVIALTHLPTDKEKNQELRSQLSQQYPHQPVIEAPYTTNSEDLMKDDSSYGAIVNLMRNHSHNSHVEHEHEHDHHEHEYDH